MFNREEIKAIGEKIDCEAYGNYRKMELDGKIKYVKSLLKLMHLNLNIIIKSMVECDFPTLSVDKTIEYYASEFLDKVITDITLIGGDYSLNENSILGTYEERVERINALVNNANNPKAYIKPSKISCTVKTRHDLYTNDNVFVPAGMTLHVLDIMIERDKIEGSPVSFLCECENDENDIFDWINLDDIEDQC